MKLQRLQNNQLEIYGSSFRTWKPRFRLVILCFLVDWKMAVTGCCCLHSYRTHGLLYSLFNKGY